MDRITTSLLKSFSEIFDLLDLDSSTQFEHFSNYSIISKSNRSSVNVYDVHTGQGNDCGIDGLCITVNRKIISDVDEVRDLIETHKTLDVEIIFIQSKTSSKFNCAEILTFTNGIKDFLAEQPLLVQNEKIKKVKEIFDFILDNSEYMYNHKPYCQIYYVTTGNWNGDENIEAVKTSSISEIGDLNLFDKLSFEIYGASDIQKTYQDTKNKLSTTIQFTNRITLPDIDGVQEAYLGVLPFNQFIQLVQDSNKKVYSIFDDNVRDFQGDNSVNNQIKNTITTGKFDLFSLLNNGVTIVANAVVATGNRFNLKDYQIVNGCQTSNILHECQEVDGVDNVHIPIKIIVTNNDDIKTEITLATNSQTAIKTEQLEALSLYQKELENFYCSSQTLNFSLYYERRSQQYNSSDVKKNQIITIPIQIKAFASMFLDCPHLVSGYYGSLVEKFSDKMFAKDHPYIAYYICGMAYYRIEQHFRNDLKTDLKKARFHLMMLAKMLAIGIETPHFNSRSMSSMCDNLEKTLKDERKSLKLFKDAEEIFLASGIDLEKRQYKSESETELLINKVNEFKQKKGTYLNYL